MARFHYLLIALLVGATSVFAQRTQVGGTLYDLQTNNSLCRRVATTPSGEIVITYTRSMEASAAPNYRGAGYNYFDGTAWSETDFTNFVRPGIDRTGWPNVLITPSGREMIVSHFASATTVPEGIEVIYRDLGSGSAWTAANNINNNQAVLQSNADATWARVASRGDSIMIINSVFGDGVQFNGVDAGIMMFRSLDGGATWTGPDTIEGINASNFTSIGGDSYAIDMNENGTVAIVCGKFQTQLFKSNDFGDSWSRTVVNPFPVPLYSGAANETFVDTQTVSDESFAVLVDNNDIAHVWYGQQVVLDDDPAEGWSYFPLDIGIRYWNENMGTAPELLPFSGLNHEPVNGNCDVLVSSAYTGGNAPDAYFQAYSSCPQAGIDQNGNIYVVFSSIRSAIIDSLGNVTNVDDDNFLYTDIFIHKSEDGGMSWIGPVNVSDAPNAESYYPSIPRNIYGNQVDVIYQEDADPGTIVQDQLGGDFTFDTNYIWHDPIAISDIVNPFFNVSIPQLDTASILQDASGSTSYVDAGITTDSCAIAEIVDTINGVDVTTLGTYNYTYVMVTVTGDTVEVDRIVTVIGADNTAPSIVLSGNSTIEIEACDTYVDPGFLAYDNLAPFDLSASVTVDASAVNTAVLGSYTVTYSVADAAGNTGSATRTVVVVDNTPPVISLAGDATTYHYLGTAYTDAGATANDPCFGPVSNLTASGAGAVDGNTAGQYVVTYEATDDNGNTAVAQRIVIVGREPVADFNALQIEPSRYAMDENCDFTPNRWDWEYSDGLTETRTNSSIFNHQWAYVPENDAYLACLTASNNFNQIFSVPADKICKDLTTGSEISESEFFIANPVTSIEDANLADALTIQPNPTNGVITLSVNGVSINATVNVIDLQGNVVASRALEGNSVTFDLSNIAKGIYVMQIISNNAQATQRFIVE